MKPDQSRTWNACTTWISPWSRNSQPASVTAKMVAPNGLISAMKPPMMQITASAAIQTQVLAKFPFTPVSAILRVLQC